MSRPLVVTGATGWIGRALVAEARGRELRLFGSAAGELDALPVRPLATIAGADVAGAEVAHLAFLTKEKADALGEGAFTATNRAIDGHLLRALGEAPPHALFVASSGAACDESHPYGRAKREQERAFLGWGAAAGVPVLAGRIFAIAGPRINKVGSYAVGSFVDQALTDGAIRIGADRPVFRSYLHVGDLARLILAALAAGEGAPEALDLCGSAMLEMADLARLVADAAGLAPESISRPPLRFDRGADAYCGDPLAMRLLALRLGVPLRSPETQVADTLAWLRGGPRPR